MTKVKIWPIYIGIFKVIIYNNSSKEAIMALRKVFNIEVSVDGNIERAIKQLKKKVEREGVIRDIKRQVYFESPTQKRRKRLMRAIKNNYLKTVARNNHG